MKLLATLPLLLILSGPAVAQELFCADRSEILSHMGEKYSEAPASAGLTATGNVMEVLSSPDGKTWTLIVSLPDGRTCFVGSGTNWQVVPRKTLGRPT